MKPLSRFALVPITKKNQVISNGGLACYSIYTRMDIFFAIKGRS